MNADYSNLIVDVSNCVDKLNICLEILNTNINNKNLVLKNSFLNRPFYVTYLFLFDFIHSSFTCCSYESLSVVVVVVVAMVTVVVVDDANALVDSLPS